MAFPRARFDWPKKFKTKTKSCGIQFGGSTAPVPWESLVRQSGGLRVEIQEKKKKSWPSGTYFYERLCGSEAATWQPCPHISIVTGPCKRSIVELLRFGHERSVLLRRVTADVFVVIVRDEVGVLFAGDRCAAGRHGSAQCRAGMANGPAGPPPSLSHAVLTGSVPCRRLKRADLPSLCRCSEFAKGFTPKWRKRPSRSVARRACCCCSSSSNSSTSSTSSRSSRLPWQSPTARWLVSSEPGTLSSDTPVKHCAWPSPPCCCRRASSSRWRRRRRCRTVPPPWWAGRPEVSRPPSRSPVSRPASAMTARTIRAARSTMARRTPRRWGVRGVSSSTCRWSRVSTWTIQTVAWRWPASAVCPSPWSNSTPTMSAKGPSRMPRASFRAGRAASVSSKSRVRSPSSGAGGSAWIFWTTRPSRPASPRMNRVRVPPAQPASARTTSPFTKTWSSSLSPSRCRWRPVQVRSYRAAPSLEKMSSF